MKKQKRTKQQPSSAGPGKPPSGAEATTPPTSRWLAAVGRALDARWFLPVVLGVAGALRLLHILAIRNTPWSSHLQLDHRLYDEWAQRVAGGEWVGTKAFFVDPLYAYFLAVIYSIAGHKPIVALFIQASLGVGTCYLTFRLGRSVRGPRLGKAAAGIVALFIPAIYYEALVEKTALSVFLFTLSLVLFIEGRTRRRLFAAGVALGLACLARGSFLAFIPLGTLALLLKDHRDEAARRNKYGPIPLPFSARVSRNREIAGVFLLGSLAFVSVVVLRNYAVAGITSTTTNLGQNLYLGNRSGNDLGTYNTPSFLRPDPRFEEDDFRTEAQKRLGRQHLTASEVSAFWRDQALSEMAEEPGNTVARTMKKLRLFWHDSEIPDSSDMYIARDDSFVLRLPLLSMGLLFPFALLGAIMSFRTSAPARTLTVVVAVYCATVVAFFILARFRIQIVPSLAVLAAGGVAWAARAVGARSRRDLALGGGIVVAGLLFSAITPAWLDEVKRPSTAIGYFNLGGLYREAGHEEAAIAAYEKAVALEPKSVIAAMRSLGELYLKRSEYEKAESHMLRVLELKPDSRLGRDALVRLYEAMTREPRYRDDAEVRSKLAAAYQRTGRARGGER